MSDSFMFDGADVLTMAFGSDLFVMGRGTLAAVVKKNADLAHQSIFQVGTADASRYLLHINNTNALALYNSATVPNPSTISIEASEGWVLLAASKDVGTVVPRFHKYAYDTN